MMSQKLTSEQAMALENQYGAHNYHPLPVVLSKGQGVYVWDVEGKRYYDFLSSYSAVNQGHCHPRIIKALTEQAQTLTLTSRAFYNDKLGVYEKYITEYFGFEKVLPMNTGAEAVETAIKICRKWAYEQKGVPESAAIIIVCDQNFHGRTTTVVSFSSDKNARKNFGPYTPGFVSVPYNDLHNHLSSHRIKFLRYVLRKRRDLLEEWYLHHGTPQQYSASLYELFVQILNLFLHLLMTNHQRMENLKLLPYGHHLVSQKRTLLSLL